MAQDAKVYSACYSNVPVLEHSFMAAGVRCSIMRRRADDWINATHILKAASYDKPTRTRILEREVQKGVHEKVQGGYGKYQGTWIPLPEGRALAERNGVLEKLLPIFDYVPGDRSPPPAPKHATAASNRPRQPRQPAPSRRVPVNAPHLNESQYDMASVGHYEEDGTPDNMTIASEAMDVDDMYGSHYGSRKRKRGVDQMSLHDQQHQIWADHLLDYFMLLESEDSYPSAPEPPPGINLDRPIDEKGHSAMHWAAAMGDIDVVKDLMRRNAKIDCLSNNLETPLMRAVMFTNNYDKQTMPLLVRVLASTVQRTDWFGSTVFHHIAATTSSKNKYKSARYYIDTLVNVLSETWISDEISRLLNVPDQNGDTCIMIAARNGARKCVRSLLGRNVQVDKPNQLGETADDLIRELNARRRQHMNRSSGGRELSSSPFPDRGPGMNGGDHHSADVARLLAPDTAHTREPNYRSATANSVATRLLPSVQDRLTGLAKAFEQEYESKVEEQVEIERVLRKRRGELEFQQKQLKELQPLEAQINSLAPEEEEREEAMLKQLEAEAEALLEMEQAAELSSLIQKNSMMGPPVSGVNGSADAMGLAGKVNAGARERREFVGAVVRGLASAGMGERQEGYKRLIRGAIGVRESDVEGMLDEVLRELEEEVRERGGAGGMEGVVVG